MILIRQCRGHLGTMLLRNCQNTRRWQCVAFVNTFLSFSSQVTTVPVDRLGHLLKQCYCFIYKLKCGMKFGFSSKLLSF